MNGPGSTVAASPVADPAAQIPRGGPLAYPLAPTVEMLLATTLHFSRKGLEILVYHRQHLRYVQLNPLVNGITTLSFNVHHHLNHCI